MKDTFEMRGYGRDILFQMETGYGFTAKIQVSMTELRRGAKFRKKNRFLIQAVTQERIDLLTASSS